ncbi:MAG: polynucleotide adenylyltransferase PcnB [Burkholderiales bacterium]
MITRLLGRMFSGRMFKPAKPRIIAVREHGISRDRIGNCALRTCDALQEAGYAAFVVGGAVRDLILGRDPKDFDVATDATPEEVRGIFRRSRIIGRRFKIVHVLCGRDMVEVTTFRGPAEEADAGHQVEDEHGRLLRDNVWGDQAQDAARRDFTINALFYDPAKEQVWDYHGGVADLKRKRLRMIGEPVQRYREDPVRMLRAVRFAASCSLEIDAATRKPIRELASLLANVPASRLFDEMLKLLLSGHAVECVKRLRKEGLHHGVLQLLDVILEQPLGERFVMLALKNTDDRIRADKTVSPAFLFAALTWHEVLAAWGKTKARGVPPVPALYEAMEKVIDRQTEQIAIPRRFTSDMKELWALQPRFEQRSGQRPFRLLEHPRFRAAYDFLLLRCESGETDAGLGDWWTRFQDADADARAGMLVTDGGDGKKRRKRRRRKSGGPAAPAAG